MFRIKNSVNKLTSTYQLNDKITVPILNADGLKNITPHDYQLHGIEWLSNSWIQRPKSGVILGDEMGLGKTLQSVSFIAHLKNTHQIKGPVLILSPLSVIDGWKQEFKRCAPSIEVLTFIGDKDSREETRENVRSHYQSSSWRDRDAPFDVLLTSYEICLKDALFIEKFSWKVLVVDEAHRLKNPSSLLYQQLQEFDIGFKVLLTGTPVQNNLKELFSLMSFVSPEIFKIDSMEDFLEYFSTISDETDSQVKSDMHAILKPFLLRRTKNEVVLDIPRKSEVVLYCGVSGEQKKLYKAILMKDFGRPLPSLAAAFKKEEDREQLSLRQKLRQKIKRQELQRAGVFSVSNDVIIEKAIKAATATPRIAPVKKEKKSTMAACKTFHKRNKVFPEIVATKSCLIKKIETEDNKDKGDVTGKEDKNDAKFETVKASTQEPDQTSSKLENSLPIAASTTSSEPREIASSSTEAAESPVFIPKEPQAHVIVKTEDGTTQQTVKIEGYSKDCRTFRRVICDVLARLFGCISVQPDTDEKKPTLLLQYFRRKKKEVKKQEKRLKIKTGKKECVSADSPVLVAFKHEGDPSSPLNVVVKSPTPKSENAKKTKISKIIPKRLFQDIDKKVNAAKLKKFLPPLKRSRVKDPVILVRKPHSVSFDIGVNMETGKLAGGRPGTPHMRCFTPGSRREHLTLEQLELKQLFAKEKRLSLFHDRMRPVSARREKVGARKVDLELLEEERKSALREHEKRREERAEFLKNKSEEERLKKVAEKQMRRERARKLKLRCDELVQLKREKDVENQTESIKRANYRRDYQMALLVQRLHERNTDVLMKSLRSKRLKDGLFDDEFFMTEVDRLAFSRQQPQNEEGPLIASPTPGSSDITDTESDGSLDDTDAAIEGSFAGIDESFDGIESGTDGRLDSADAGINGSIDVAIARIYGSFDVTVSGMNESFDVSDADENKDTYGKFEFDEAFYDEFDSVRDF